MPVRSTMSDLIARVRRMIGDMTGPNQFFSDQEIQEYLDAGRNDLRYESLAIAPSIVNPGQGAASAETIYADYYSAYGFFESDVVLQGQGTNATPWVVLTPLLSELLLEQAHWQFELNVFQTGTAPGQMPPVFLVGKSFDIYYASADLLEVWAAQSSDAYDISVDGQSLHRSQLMANKLKLADVYRKKARPRRAKMTRSDIMSPIGARRMRLLDNDDIIRGG